VILANVGEDGMHKQDRGCPVGNRGTKNLEEYQVMKVSFKFPKKGMLIDEKKVRLADSNFGPVVLNIYI
jgi:hypothetical protein